MARITGKEAQGLMAAYARVHAPEIKEDVSEEILSEETSREEELQDLSEEELQEILGALRKAGSAIGSKVKQGVQAAGGAINKAKEVAGNVKTAVGNEIQKRREQVTDLRRGGISQVKQGNEARKDIAQTRDKLANQTSAAKSGSVDAQSGMGNDPGATRAQLAFKEKQRQKQLGTYQKPKTAQELAKERLAKKKEANMEEYTPYDLVLNYLMSTEQTATIEEANYVMTEMDAETIQSIVEEQKKNLMKDLT